MSIDIHAHMDARPVTIDTGFPIVVPRIVSIDIQSGDHDPLRLLGDLLGCDKALYCFDRRELHTPAVVTGEQRHTFMFSVVSALTCAAEGLGLVDAQEGGPTFEIVCEYAARVNDAICVPPLNPVWLEVACTTAYERAEKDRATYYTVAGFEHKESTPPYVDEEERDEKSGPSSKHPLFARDAEE
ncbi:hypothetical protein [Paratractidigestivibacter sp.]|uniref:hypothetical protein n=1 Tax=Paratractidigestivibacter sp. TaxID=2847316 RepID=UPI002AC94142|nr:hypothetical protein [Paratractidigestivibacter sp.]